MRLHNNMQQSDRRPQLWVIVPAAGIGSRFGGILPKQYAVMRNHKTVLDNTLTALLKHVTIERVMLVLHPNDTYWQHSIFYNEDRMMTTAGGHDRAHSVFNGLLALTDVVSENDWVFVHDACRPCISHHDIDELLSLMINDHPVGGLLAVPLTDTIKHVDKGCVTATVSRQQLWRAQTPQLFRYGLLKQALTTAFAKDFLVTDESSAIELLGLQPAIIQGSTQNLKITYPEDLNTL